MSYQYVVEFRRSILVLMPNFLTVLGIPSCPPPKDPKSFPKHFPHQIETY